jgi:K+-sensing histidine kinase KdpD
VQTRQRVQAAVVVVVSLITGVVLLSAPAFVSLTFAIIAAIGWCIWLEGHSHGLIFGAPGVRMNYRTPRVAREDLPDRVRQPTELGTLGAGLVAIGLLTTAYFAWLHVTNQTIVALSFLLVVLMVATIATRRVAIATSLLAFLCFNYFFLPPVGTWSVADPENWAALLTLLAVSLVASHLSTRVRQQAIERIHLLQEREEAEIVRRGAELKSALLSSLSHDLKTPLTALTVAASSLDASWLSEEDRREQAAIVRTELERLNRLFEDIVEMARIESHAVAAELEWVQPAEIIEAAERQVERALRAHRVEAEEGVEKALVRVDPRLTSAALAHLLENAAQYSPPGSTITVRVALLPTELQIAVRDEGVGVPPQDLDRLFDRYYRAADARQPRFGTGMGLAITRGLLAAEGGRVWAGNHPDGGAIFTIAIPAESRTAVELEAESL